MPPITRTIFRADRFQRVRTCVRHDRAGHDPAAATQHEPLHVYQRLLAGVSIRRLSTCGTCSTFRSPRPMRLSRRLPRRFRRVGDDEGLPRPCADLPRVRLLPPDQRVPVSLPAANKDLPACSGHRGDPSARICRAPRWSRSTNALPTTWRSAAYFEEIDTTTPVPGPISTPAWLPFCAPVSHWSWRTGGKLSRWPTIFCQIHAVSKENYNSGFNCIENVPSLIFGFKMTADNCQTWATWCSQMDPYMSGYVRVCGPSVRSTPTSMRV